MARVELRVGPLPAQVRLVRLVAAAVARRAGLNAEALDEVRLAVAEACGMALHADQAEDGDLATLLPATEMSGQPLAVDFDDDAGLVVTVHAASDVLDQNLDTSSTDPALDRLALLQGLLDDHISVFTSDGTSTIRMAWSLTD